MGKPITEALGVHEKFYEDAKKQTMKTLPKFLKSLMENYQHDYGTVCHAISAGAVATATALNRSPGSNGGITGFQASFVMWGFIQHWMSYEQPLKLTDYQTMLYPQYEHYFHSITKDTWEWLQKEARKNLDAEEGSPTVRAHWESIVQGKIPFGYKLER